MLFHRCGNWLVTIKLSKWGSNSCLLTLPSPQPTATSKVPTWTPSVWAWRTAEPQLSSKSRWGSYCFGQSHFRFRELRRDTQSTKIRTFISSSRPNAKLNHFDQYSLRTTGKTGPKNMLEGIRNSKIMNYQAKIWEWTEIQGAEFGIGSGISSGGEWKPSSVSDRLGSPSPPRQRDWNPRILRLDFSGHF